MIKVDLLFRHILRTLNPALRAFASNFIGGPNSETIVLMLPCTAGDR